MTKIKKYVDDIAEELDGAKNYIEKALEYLNTPFLWGEKNPLRED